DVEDPDATETLGTDRRLNALRAAVDPPAGLLHRHEQQIAVNRHIALSARAYDRREQPRPLGAVDVVGIESVEAPHEEMISTEREIRVRETQSGRRLRRRGSSGRLPWSLRRWRAGRLARRRLPRSRRRGIALRRLFVAFGRRRRTS